MFLLVDNYDSFTYNLFALFKEAGVDLDVIKNDEFKDASNYEGIIISPGPSNPQNSGFSMKYIEEYAGKKPIFGVCLGMQCIAYYKTGIIRSAKTIMHGKIDEIVKTNDSRILKGLPDRFKSVRYHSLAIEVSEQFVCARALSDNEIMAIEFNEEKLYGVQFHPESIKSEYGLQIVNNFIKICREDVT
ncbi:aminodeoxychorismate/anthranilate synthase component II [Deferribacter autotrophicus]|uniref:Aminodeoxychorismate/anthranilate synthase component II n=1 Tax=Deferribacter autotrophicus TaxID=500465 RepID=A0A5A8F2H5_9BACT|nr:aminodeoxychorismate/anthranilate synthase component II [Deferribacter autotrophicus]KAA0257095.1 aminodeoxychorismate/anthranilate synthase component II [Deferribacter autotrophicus]